MRMSKKKFLYLLSFAVIILGLVLLFIFSKDERKKSTRSEQEPQLEGYKVYLCESNNFSSKMIYISKESNELKRIERILENFFSELNTLKMRVNCLYRDRENRIYLDISAVPTSMDTKNEYCFLKSLYFTIKNNFSWVTDVKILVSGSEKESLAGHILVDSLRESMEDR